MNTKGSTSYRNGKKASLLRTGLVRSVPLLLLVLALAACGNGSKSGGDGAAADGSSSGKSTASATPAEPVTVTFGATKSMLNLNNEASFDKYVAGPVKKKYPNITVKHQDTSIGFEKLVSSGQVPDIISVWYENLVDVNSLQLTTPLEPLIKKFNFDQSRIDPSAWQSLKNLTNSTNIVGIPTTYSKPALFYNKDLFDKFGVKYPDSGMTWEQASALGKRMSQTMDGVQYVGFHPLSIFRLQMQLNLPYLDPKTGKAAINTDAWVKLYTGLQTIYQDQNIPNTLYSDSPADKAWGQGQIAMIAGYPQLGITASNSHLNWDMTTYPQSTDKMGYAWRSDGNFAVITPQAKDRDAAFKVLEVLDSPEVQDLMSQDGIFPVLSDKNIEADFGKNTDQFKGKNTKAFFTYKTSPAIAIPKLYKTSVRSLMDAAFYTDIMKNHQDVNSALRKANELFQQTMDENS